MIDDSFEEGTEDWRGAIENENGRLKVKVLNRYSGTYKEIDNVLSKDEELAIKLTVDTYTTTVPIRVLISERDAENNSLGWYYVGSAENGSFSVKHKIKKANTASIYLKLDIEETLATETEFYIYAISISRGSLIVKEEKNYYPFGMVQKGYNNLVTGRKHNYGYNGKEENLDLGLDWYDYGARNYDSSIGRWMNIDPLAEKYPHFTPYHYVYNNPINFIDPDGEEGIVVSGQPGNHKNKSHFLANGFNKALAAQKRVQEKSEKVTWIVYNDGSKYAGHSPAQLKEYKKKAEKAGINFKIVNKSDDIVDYINNKTGGDSREKDKISSFYYVGYATPGDLDVGYGGSGENFEPDDLDSEAFRSGAWVNCIGGCRTSVPGVFEDSVLTQFAEILDELSTVYGVDVRVYYSGGVQSDEAIAKKNNGTLIKRNGELPAKKK